MIKLGDASAKPQTAAHRPTRETIVSDSFTFVTGDHSSGDVFQVPCQRPSRDMNLFFVFYSSWRRTAMFARSSECRP